jgi:fibronectin-binding autotransporter adhesin
MHHHPLPRRLLSLLALLAIASPSAAPAANYTWVGASPLAFPGNSNWSTLANWSTGIAPPNDGTADLIFSGNLRVNPTANTAWNINTLTFSGTDQTFTVGGSTLTLSTDGTFAVTPLIINSSSHNHIINNTLVFANNGTINASTGDLTFGGSYISNDGNTVTLTAGSGRTLTFDTVLTGLGNYTKTGAGTALVNNTSIYTGITTISAGTLQLAGSINNSDTVNLTGGTLRLAASERLSNSAVLTMSSGTVFDLAGYTETIQRLTGAGSVTLGTGGSLILNQDSGSYTFSGVISGAGNFTKGGLGTLALTGANSLTGGTTITGGILSIGDGGTTGSITGSITNNSALRFNRSNALTYSGAHSGTGSLTKLGAGTLTFTGNHTHTGGTTVSAGTLQIGSGGTTGSIAGNITNNSGLNFNRSNALTFAGVISGSGSVTKLGAGTLTLTATNSYSGGTAINAGTLQIGNGGTTGFITGNVNNQGDLVFNRSNNVNFLYDHFGLGALTKLGTGTLTLGGDHTHTGGTWVEAGTLEVGGGSVSGSLSGAIVNNAAVVFNRTGTVTYDGVMSGAGTLTKIGSGNLIVTGSSTFTGATTIDAGRITLGGSERLSANSALTLGTNGILDLGAYAQTVASLSGTGLVLANSGTLIVEGTASTSYAGDFNGSGTILKDGSGTLTLSGTVPALFNLSVNSGTLRATGTVLGTNVQIFGGTFELVGNNRLPTSAGVSVNNSGILALVNAGQSQEIASLTGNGTVALGSGLLLLTNQANITFNGRFTGSGVFAKEGNGTLTWGGSATSTNTGPVFADQGTLRLGSSNRLSAGTILSTNLPGTSTFDLNGFNQTVGGLSGFDQDRILLSSASTLTVQKTSDNHSATPSIIGGGNLVMSGTGSQTLNLGDTTNWTGQLTVNAGTLVLNNAAFLDGIAVNGGTLRSTHLGSLDVSGYAPSLTPIVVNGPAAPAGPRPLLEFTGGTASVWDTGKDLVVNGGALTVTGANFAVYNGSQVFLSSNAHAAALGTFNHALVLDDQGYFSATAGATVNVGGNLTLSHYTANKSELVASGAGTSLTVGGTTTLHQTAEFGLRQGATFNAAGTITVQNSAGFNLDTGATLTLTGAGAELIARNDAAIQVNGATINQQGASGGLRVDNTATVHFENATGSFTHLRGTGGSIVIDNSTLSFGVNHRIVPGIIFNTGDVTFGSDLVIGAGGTFGTALTLQSDRTLTIAGADTTIAAGATLTLNGGRFSTRELYNQGTFAFLSGTLALTGNGGLTVGSGGTLGVNYTLNGGTAIEVPNGSLSVNAGSTFTVIGGNLDARGAVVTGTYRADAGVNQFGPDGLAINPDGRVFVTGNLTLGGASTNAGRLTLQNGTGLVSGSTLVNTGLLLGDGALASAVTNQAGGEIRAEAGRTLGFTAATGLVNQGTLNLLGGSVELSGALQNSAGGIIAGRGAIYVSGGLNNAGTLNLSGGVTDIYGTVTNHNGGTIITTGGYAGVTTFHGDVAHDGAEIRTSTGSATVFFGTLSGTGAFTGAGLVLIEGELSPGNSPGIMPFTNLALEAGSSALWEINDATGAAGINWDLLQVSGTLTINATAFSPHTISLASLNFAHESAPIVNFDAGQSYSFAYATAGGGVIGFSADKFVLDTTDFLNPFDGAWSVALDGNSINLVYSATAVPEPSAYAAMAGALALVGAILRRRRQRSV